MQIFRSELIHNTRYLCEVNIGNIISCYQHLTGQQISTCEM